MRLLIFIACLLPLSAFAEGLQLPKDDSSVWGVATVHSYHMNREVHHNEVNYGVGLEYHFNPTWRLVAGEYENSYYRHTNYAGTMWMPVDMTHGFRFGALAAMVSGYNADQPQSYQFAIVPMFTYESDRFGANLMALIGGAHRGAAALQVKVKF